MVENNVVLFLAALAFAGIATITWFFSTRRRLFIRVFCRRENYIDAVRGLGNDADFCSSMTRIAKLQFGLAFIVLVAWVIAAS